MKVYIGADHRGFGFKKKIISMLEQLEHKVIDLGTYTDQQPCDYPDIAKEVGEHVSKERDVRGILVCMSGIGLTIAANKVKGVYAALCYNVETAELSRMHNNANVLVLSAKFVEEKDLFQMLETWMTTPFEGGRHLARVKKIMDMEERFAPAPRVQSVSPSAPVEREDRSRSSFEDKPERSERRESHARSEREGRPTYSTSKTPYRKEGERSYPAKKPYSNERSYEKPQRADSRGEGRPFYASRRPDDRTNSDRPRPSYSRDRSEGTSRPQSADRGNRRDEGRSSYPSSRKPAYRKDEGRSYSGVKKPYSSERSYARPTRPGSSRGDERPSYASRRPDDRKMSDRQRPAYAKDRPKSFDRPREERSDSRGPRKPYSSEKPRFSPKPGGARSSAPRKRT